MAQSSSYTPHGLTTFEHVAQRLGLSPAQYESSEALKEWARRHKNDKYIPLDLLKAWGFEVSVELFKTSEKHAGERRD